MFNCDYIGIVSIFYLKYLNFVFVFLSIQLRARQVRRPGGHHGSTCLAADQRACGLLGGVRPPGVPHVGPRARIPSDRRDPVPQKKSQPSFTDGQPFSQARQGLSPSRNPGDAARSRRATRLPLLGNPQCRQVIGDLLENLLQGVPVGGKVVEGCLGLGGDLLEERLKRS